MNITNPFFKSLKTYFWCWMCQSSNNFFFSARIKEIFPCVCVTKHSLTKADTDAAMAPKTLETSRPHLIITKGGTNLRPSFSPKHQAERAAAKLCNRDSRSLDPSSNDSSAFVVSESGRCSQPSVSILSCTCGAFLSVVLRCSHAPPDLATVCTILHVTELPAIHPADPKTQTFN